MGRAMDRVEERPAVREDSAPEQRTSAQQTAEKDKSQKSATDVKTTDKNGKSEKPERPKAETKAEETQPPTVNVAPATPNPPPPVILSLLGMDLRADIPAADTSEATTQQAVAPTEGSASADPLVETPSPKSAGKTPAGAVLTRGELAFHLWIDTASPQAAPEPTTARKAEPTEKLAATIPESVSTPAKSSTPAPTPASMPQASEPAPIPQGGSTDKATSTAETVKPITGGTNDKPTSSHSNPHSNSQSHSEPLPAPAEVVHSDAPAPATFSMKAETPLANASISAKPDVQAVEQTTIASPIEATKPRSAEPLREIAIQLPDSANGKVDVHIVERAGKIEVDVRSNPELAQGLRTHVDELVSQLHDKGYEAGTRTAEAIHGAATLDASGQQMMQDSARDPSKGEDRDAQGRQQQPDGRQQDQQRRRSAASWSQYIDSEAEALGAPPTREF